MAVTVLDGSYAEAAISTASSISTDTSLDTPASCMVTPSNCRVISMVILLWVMMMNCTSFDIVLTISRNLPTLLSSSGASTSSRIQNGAGFNLKMEKTSATAVRAFSPPDKRWILLFFFPGGLAMTVTPVSSRS